MARNDRLFQITQLLGDGALHRAEDIAKALGVSLRTVYRDMDRLVASGLPVSGTRGAGYVLEDVIALPPLSIAPAELEALNLGLAVVAQAADDETRAAAMSLSDKIDAATTAQAQPHSDVWRYAASPYADATRNLAHMPLLRAAIKARQKVRVTYTSPEGGVTGRVIRPLKMQYWGHVWALTAWCELRSDFRVFQLDLMQSIEALPQLFTDEPGKRLRDFEA